MQIFIDMIFMIQCLDAVLASGGITVVVVEDSCQSQMNHARPMRTPKQHAPCRRVAAVVLESARKRPNPNCLHARQTSEVVAAVDVAVTGVVARNLVRSVYRRRESAIRQLILCVEGRPAHRVVLHSHRVLAEAVTLEPSNVQGANLASRFSA